MTDREMFRALADIGREIGARILYGRPRHRGGACTWQTSDFVVIHRDSELEERIALLLEYLADKNLDGVEMPQAVRDRIDLAQREEGVKSGVQR